MTSSRLPSARVGLLTFGLLTGYGCADGPEPERLDVRADQLTQQDLKLTAPTPVTDDRFGVDIALDGDLLAVGARGDDTVASDAGAVYLFQRDLGGTDNWGLLTKLTPSAGVSFGRFGDAVALDGNTLVVGEPQGMVGGVRTGAIYVFGLESGAWVEQARLVASDGESGDQLGQDRALDISGDRIVAGAPREDENGGDAGAAYVFHRDGLGTWSQEAKLTASDGSAIEQFGASVAIDGESLVVGSPFALVGATRPGAAYVYTLQLGSWIEQAKLLASDGADDEFFGAAVEVALDEVIVGAYEHASHGAAYQYLRDLGGTDAWGEASKVVPSDPSTSQHFGFAVDLEGDALTIGAQQDADAAASAGSAYLFERQAGDWAEVEKLLASDAAASDFLGYSVAVGPAVVAAGAPLEDEPGVTSNAGAVYVLHRAVDDPCADVVCPEKHLCHEGACLEVEDCSSHSDCAYLGNTAACAQGSCVVGTSCEGVDCPEGETCYAGACFAGPPCDSDLDCAELGDAACVNSTCVLSPSCVEVSCPAGDQCYAGACFATAQCQDDADCETLLGPEAGCVHGACVAAPDCADVACPEGEVCYAGACFETPECRDDSDCPGGTCASGTCIQDPACEGVICGADEACYRGSCLLEVDCKEDADCVSGERCVSGACAPGDSCAGITCASGQTCHAGACFTVAPGCATDADCLDTDLDDPICDHGTCTGNEACEAVTCATDERCFKGSCFQVLPACEDDEDCQSLLGADYICASGACLLTGPDACADVSCPSGETCWNGSCLQTLPTCERDDDCADLGGSATCIAGTCASVEDPCDAVSCPAGEACLAGACLEQVECTIDDHCASGEQCTDGLCVAP